MNLDVESTGASTEFYDKFNIRRSIQVIFRSLWSSTIYRSNITSYARSIFLSIIKICLMDFLGDFDPVELKKFFLIQAENFREDHNITMRVVSIINNC